MLLIYLLSDNYQVFCTFELDENVLSIFADLFFHLKQR